MTLLGQMLREDGWQQGQLFKLVTQVKKKFEKGQSPAQIAEDLMEEKETVEQIVRLLSEHPEAALSEICELIKEK